MKRITFVTGGARSGKSHYALELARKSPPNRIFLATAQVTDQEMRERIRHHQDERGPEFSTMEEPRDLAAAITRIPKDAGVVLIDCLTVWLGNLMHAHGEECREYPEVADFLAALQSPPCDLIIVSNELGMGIVPPTPMGRQFRDIAGRLNQQIAAMADRAVLLVSGLPIPLKGELE